MASTANWLTSRIYCTANFHYFFILYVSYYCQIHCLGLLYGHWYFNGRFKMCIPYFSLALKSFGLQNLYHICVVRCHHDHYIEFSKNNLTHTWQNGWSCMQTSHSAHWAHKGGGSPSSHPSFPHLCPPAQFHCSSWKLHCKLEASISASQHSTTDSEVLCHKNQYYRNDSLKACDCIIH